jgi:hypothetical protein
VLEEVARRTGLPDIVAEFVAPVMRRRPLVGAPDPVEVLVDVVRLAAKHSAEDRNAAREKILVERHINVRWLDFNSALTGVALTTYKTPAERRADEDREFLQILGLTAAEGTAARSAEREMISRSQEPERFNFIMTEARKRGLPVAQTWERHGYMVLDAGQLTALEGLTSSNSRERCALPSTPAD